MAIGPINVSNRTSRVIVGVVLIGALTAVMGGVLAQTMPGLIGDFKRDIADGNGAAVAVVIGLTTFLTLILGGATVWAFWKDGDRIKAWLLPQDEDDDR